jgi:predicted Zn-dependent protease
MKPIYVRTQEGVKEEEKEAILDGIRCLVAYAGKIPEIREGDAEKYIEPARRTSRNSHQLNTSTLGKLFLEEQLQEQENRYDILIVREDLYSRDTNFVIGSAFSGVGAVLSPLRFANLNPNSRFECIKTEAIHELGHVFYLPNKCRRKNITENLGVHCTNVCSMRQGLVIPSDWIKITEDRLKFGALCGDCTKELKLVLRY